MLLATAVTYPIQHFVLDQNNLGYLQTIVFILVIAALVQLVEIILKKYIPALHASLGVYLPFNHFAAAPFFSAQFCPLHAAALGQPSQLKSEMFANKNNAFDSALDAIGMGVGYTLAMLAMASIREIFGAGTW